MIAANQRLIKATAKHGVLSIQTTLITIYSSNLSAIATQATLLAGFAFQFVTTQRDVRTTENLALAYFYYSCYTVTLVTAIFVVSQATVATIYGPWLAFKSEDNMAVQNAQDEMRSQANLIIKVAVACITSLFVGLSVQTWSIYDVGIAAICTAIYAVGYYWVILYGRNAYLLLLPRDDMFRKHKGNVVKELMTRRWCRVRTRKDRRGGGGGEDQYDPEMEKLKLARVLKDCVEKTSHQGVLFVRDPISQGGNFRKRFVTLSGGRMDIFKDEADISNANDPVNAKPIKLYQYKFSRNPQEFNRKFMNIGSAFKELTTGMRRDFYMQDVLMAGDVNLETAYDHFRFALVPVSIDELSHKEVIEFVAVDETKFDDWQHVICTVVEAYSHMRNPNLTTKDTLLSGGNVSMASYIQAASGEAATN